MTALPAELTVYFACTCGRVWQSPAEACTHPPWHNFESRAFVDVVELSAVVRAIAHEERRERARDK